MADYKQTTVAGTLWNRFGRIEIDNTRNGVPSIVCAEQSVIILGSNEIVKEVGTLRFDFDATAEFPILDPVTNTVQNDDWLEALPKGMRTYVLIYSYVLSQASLRDV